MVVVWSTSTSTTWKSDRPVTARNGSLLRKELECRRFDNIVPPRDRSSPRSNRCIAVALDTQVIFGTCTTSARSGSLGVALDYEEEPPRRFFVVGDFAERYQIAAQLWRAAVVVDPERRGGCSSEAVPEGNRPKQETER